MRADDVADADDRRAGLAGDLDRLDRVGRLAGLRHRDRQRARVHRPVAVAKLRGELHLDRNLAQRAHQVHADHAGVVGGAAAGDRDLRHRAQHDLLDLQFGGELHVERFVDAARSASP